jgi:hypothetical protein
VRMAVRTAAAMAAAVAAMAVLAGAARFCHACIRSMWVGYLAAVAVAAVLHSPFL